MTISEIITEPAINLDDYQIADIRFLGSIQAYGVLIILNQPDLTICQVSQNTQQWLGYQSEDLINQPLSLILPQEQIDIINDCLAGDFNHINPLNLTINNQFFNGIIHRSQNYTFLELEPLNNPSNTNFFQFYQITRTILKKIQKTSNLTELSNIIVQEIKQLTGFDRVMIYCFDEDGSGHVIAEEKREDLESFLDLHYPATDIDHISRHLYTLNYIRLIPDINYTPVVLPNHPETEEPFDLSLSILRGVYPCHLEYLNNMGVTASMSISLIHNNQAWGLVSCHHYSPKYVPYSIRTVCEFLGQVMSIELPSKQEHEYLTDKISLKNIQTNLINSLSQSDDLIESLVKHSDQLKNLVHADGLAICQDSQLFLSGKTPDEHDIYDLIDWLETKIEDDVFYTDRLPHIYSPAKQFKDAASGVLILALTRVSRYYILWFRTEVIQTVNWAGNPHEFVKVEEEDGSIKLSPRQSFKKWQETVQYQSLPWKKYEVQEAIELKNAAIGIVLKKADELAALNLELQRSNKELDAFTYIASHDLKEPLRGIHNYSSFLLEDYEELLDEDGKDKLQTLVRLTKRMEELIEGLLRYSRIGRTELEIQPLDLGILVTNIVSMLKVSVQDPSWEVQIPKTLPIINGDRILLEEILTNLIINGLKYNDKPHKTVEISYLDPETTPETPDSSYIFYVKDNGIGIREKHLDVIFRIFKRLHGQNQYGGGTGVGLTIVKRIIECHGGKIWVESTYQEGTTFYFTLG